jgi:hypothetical protein
VNLTECLAAQVDDYDGVMKCPQAGVLCISSRDRLDVTSAPVPSTDNSMSTPIPLSNKTTFTSCASCAISATTDREKTVSGKNCCEVCEDYYIAPQRKLDAILSRFSYAVQVTYLHMHDTIQNGNCERMSQIKLNIVNRKS